MSIEKGNSNNDILKLLKSYGIYLNTKELYLNYDSEGYLDLFYLKDELIMINELSYHKNAQIESLLPSYENVLVNL